MVSATPSAGWLQSSPVIPELGFPMGTRGQMFWLKPGLPNSLEPGKRPRTTLSPSFALRDGKPWMAFGTPGGEQQDQWSLIMFLRMAAEMPPAWQFAVSIGLMLVSIWAVLWIASRLYRVGILMYGKRATLPELLRWLRYS